MVKYFIGNVLSPTNTQPEQHDPTFAFTKKEAFDLDLTGKPIRMEHHPELEVGNIMRNWQAEDGSVWITGKLKDDTLESKFSQYAIDKNPVTGESYYTGLSLQHTHIQFASSNNSVKEGVEVSLCVNPRRKDCRICFVDSDPNQDKTKKIVYKMHNASFKTNMSQVEQTPATQEQVTESPVEKAPSSETSAPMEAAPNGSSSTEMSREDMMRVIIQQQKELEQQQHTKSSEAEELQQLKNMLEEQKANELKKDQEKAYALSKALVDQWAETLNETEFDPQSRESVMKMAKEYPRESMALMKVAHCASSKMKSLKSQFTEYKEVMKRSQLQEKFESVMSKKRPVQEVIHAASTKKQKTVAAPQKSNNVQMFLKAMSRYNSSGSARDHMDAVSQIGTRRNMPRAPYY